MKAMDINSKVSAQSSSGNAGSVNINPVALNLGAILQPYKEGSVENGGIIHTIGSRYIDYLNSDKPVLNTKVLKKISNKQKVLFSGVGIITGVVIFLIVRKIQGG